AAARSAVAAAEEVPARRLEPRACRPGRALRPREQLAAAHVPQPPAEDRLGEERGVRHAGTGSTAGSSAGAVLGTGSSSGLTSTSRSVSGSPMSMAPDSATPVDVSGAVAGPAIA